MSLKRPAHKEQHLCADKAYDVSDVREFASSEGYTTHIKINPRKKEATESRGESPQRKDSHGEPHPARRWVVERTISWLTKRRSLRTRWSKKAENWLALVQLACAHILLNLAVFGWSLRVNRPGVAGFVLEKDQRERKGGDERRLAREEITWIRGRTLVFRLGTDTRKTRPQ